MVMMVMIAMMITLMMIGIMMLTVMMVAIMMLTVMVVMLALLRCSVDRSIIRHRRQLLRLFLRENHLDFVIVRLAFHKNSFYDNEVIRCTS